MIFLQLFIVFLPDRHLRIRRWLFHDIPDSGTGSNAVSLDDDARVYRCGGHLTDDTGTYRYQHRHLLRLYRCAQCRHGRHDGHTRKCRGNLCPMVLPSLILMILISKMLYKYMNTSMVQSIFIGLRPCIVGPVGAAALLLMTPENFSTPENPWHFYISIALFFATFIGVKRNEDQSYPHDTLLGFRRAGITILNKILLCYLAVINKSRKFEKRNGENPSPFTLST